MEFLAIQVSLILTSFPETSLSCPGNKIRAEQEGPKTHPVGWIDGRLIA